MEKTNLNLFSTLFLHLCLYEKQSICTCVHLICIHFQIPNHHFASLLALICHSVALLGLHWKTVFVLGNASYLSATIYKEMIFAISEVILMPHNQRKKLFSLVASAVNSFDANFCLLFSIYETAY